MQYSKLESVLNEDGIIFLQYGGELTQSLIVAMTDILEKEVENNLIGLKTSSNIFTIFIEMSQNLMNYGKRNREKGLNFNTRGLIIIGLKEGNGERPENYYIISRNLITEVDKAVIQERLDAVEGLDNEALRKLYRTLRKSGRDKHSQGAGIGFVEIARRCDSLTHTIKKGPDGLYHFTLKAKIFLEEVKHE
jgi:hypothetical protein